MYEEYVGKEMPLEEAAKLRGKIKLCGIYSITNKIDCKVYVGLSKSIYARANDHTNCTTNKHLSSAIAKYGIENFVHKAEVLCSEEELAVNENAVFDKYVAAGTVMYNIAKCGNIGNKMEFATDEQKAECTAKMKAAHARMTVREKADKSTKISASVKSYLASRTAEEKAGINAKISTKTKATLTAKFCTVVEDTIKFCLQNKLYIFSKYKQYCSTNNLQLQVSISYFGKLMQFATYKEQLADFVAVYKEGMDYSTYTTLCKLKPITKEVYAVTVKYSTYKYFI